MPEIQAISDERFAEFLDDPALTEWQTQLRKIRRNKPHVLSEPEERLLALGSAALDGYDDTFSQLTDVDMKFGVLTDAEGQERPLTQSSFSSFLVKRDHGLRKRAFHQFYAEFQDHQFTLASSLSYSVKADVFRARARNFPSALEASLFRDDVPSAVYDGLISAVRANLAPLFRYYELRRRVLGLDELHHYDTYVPLVPEIETNVSFDEAVERVLASLAPLGAEYVSALGDGLRGRWCDRYETKGKRSGAFSSRQLRRAALHPDELQRATSFPMFTRSRMKPVIRCTPGSRKRRKRFRTTITRSSSRRSPPPSTKNCSPITCSRKPRIPKMRAYIINRQIDDIRGTLFRQTMFAEFEKIIHAIEERGDALTLDVFKSEYRALLQAYFGAGCRARSGARSRMPAHPAFLQRLLRLQICDRHFRRGRAVRAGARRNARRSRGLSRLSAVRRLEVPSRNPAKRRRGHDDFRPVESTLRLFERRLGELEALLL